MSSGRNSEDISDMIATIHSNGPVLDDVVMHAIEVVNGLLWGRTNKIDNKTPTDRARGLEVISGWSA
jgi:hypothetical protein